MNNSPLRQDLALSINDKVIMPFREGLFSRNFAYEKFHENKVLPKNSKFTVVILRWVLLRQISKVVSKGMVSAT